MNTCTKMFVPGRQFAFILFIVLSSVIYYTISLARKGQIPYVRRLVAIDAIEEAVGRAAEMGRIVHSACGEGSLTTEYAAETLAGISAINYTARIAAQKGADLLVTVVETDVEMLARETVRSAFNAEGESEKFNDDMVRYIPKGTAYDSAIMAIAERERPGANIIIGAYWHAALFLLETMNKVGAMSIGGTTREIMTPFFIGSCDYFLMSEEVLAVGAYLSDNPVSKGSLRGQDYAKYFAVAYIILSTIALSLGNSILLNLLGW